jgi:surface carbohydrate biosynthesis protein
LVGLQLNPIHAIFAIYPAAKNMNANINSLLIPVENQVRELDPKLLLACFAARRGFTSVIGSRREMELSIDSFPNSVYLSKSMTVRSLLFFEVASQLGHKIVAWDEEALVHLPPETYYSRRLHPKAIKHVSHLFAWGEDNAELWRRYPALSKSTPIHITGNPRGDLLRPEIMHFYQEEVDELRKRYGDFVLINTNFNHINAFGPDMNLFKPVKKAGRKPEFGRAARGMSRSYAEGLRDHKQAVLEDFKRLIPKLEKAFPEVAVVIRPHPTENHQIYRQIAERCERVRVTNEGNVVPWLMATRAVIHNGCTTGVEAYVLGVPAISYRPTVNENYDEGFYQLPNRVSHQCFDFEELCDTLSRIFAGKIGAADGANRRTLVERHLAARNGPFASERIVEILERIAAQPGQSNGHRRGRIAGWLERKGLHLVKRFNSWLPGSHNRPEFQRHRYPGISLPEFKAKLAKFQQALGDRTAIDVEQITNAVFRLTPVRNGYEKHLPGPARPEDA